MSNEEDSEFPASNIHVLMVSKTLCGMHDLPCDWPPGHAWVRIEYWLAATCQVCLMAGRGMYERLVNEDNSRKPAEPEGGPDADRETGG